MSQSINVSRLQIGDFEVTWGTYVFGAVDKVTKDLKYKSKPIKVGNLGDVVLGDRVLGLEEGSSIKVDCREVDVATIKALLANSATAGQASQNGSTTASIPITPGLHTDLYDLAQSLMLHPTERTDAFRDETYYKAVPILPKEDRDGVKDVVLEVTFRLYPDRTKFPAIKYGYIGGSDPG